MTIYCMGNPLVNGDSIPLKLIPLISRAFPDWKVVEADPSEDFTPEEESVILDSVEGINDIRWFNDINDFIAVRSVTLHDYDLGFHLRMLYKLGKIKKVKILGVPAKISLKKATPEIISKLSS